MTVACKNQNCYYYEKGFCAKEITTIDENGMCCQCWRKGQPWRASEQGPRVNINIEEGKILAENNE